MNATIDANIMATNAIGEMGSGWSWIITIISFIAILLLIFMLSKNIRQFIYGSITLLIIGGIYKLSRWIGIQTAIKHDINPLKWFGIIAGFIIGSIILGKILSKFKFVKEFEDAMKESKNEGQK